MLISKHFYLCHTQQKAMASIRTQRRHSWLLVSRQSLFPRLSPVHPRQHALFPSYVVVSVLFSSLLQNVRGFLLQNVNSLIKFWCHTSGQRPLYDRPLEIKWLSSSFSRLGFGTPCPRDESFMNPTRILCCLKTPNASTSTQRNCLFSCSP